MDIHSEKQLLEKYEIAPKAIQDSLSDGSAIDFIMSMQDRYKFHIDVAQHVMELIRDLLLGFLSPADFFSELQMSGIDADTSKKLVEDLNKEVFIPMREKMKSEGSKVILPGNIGTKDLARIEIVNNEKQPIASADIQIQESSTSTPSLVSVPSYAPVAPPQPLIEPIPPLPEIQAPVVTPEASPEIRTMASDMAAVKAGESPHFVPARPLSAPTSTWVPAPQAPIAPPSPQPEYVPIPAPSSDASHAPMPPASPPKFIPTPPLPRPKPAAANTENRDSLHAVLKSYGIDPYREPAE
ncbi:hypothetical protein H0X32_03790 [Patescibacteria group bacterium]|nr:hypothetical protein [Patescibacteria group bacterium]